MLGIGALGALSLGDVPAGTPETSLPSKWHAPLAEPVRQRIAPTLAVALIASGATVPPIAPFPESVTESRWHQPWSEPVVKARPRLAEAHQQFLAWQPAPSPFVATGWYAPLSAPVRIKPALLAGSQQFLAPDPRPLVSFSWFGWLPEPVRLKPGLPAGQQQFLAAPAWPDINVAWWRPLEEPVRVRPAVLVPAPEQQFQPFDEDIIFVDRWFAWWSEPVRVRPALGAPHQQVLAFDPQPYPFLGGGGGWWPKVKKPGAPRKVIPAATPPTFAETIAAQQPARLADVLGSAFVPQLGQLQPPALDLYRPGPRPVATPPVIAPAVTDAAADHVDAIDAMEALRAVDMLEQQEREMVIAALLRMASSE
jgi:hypothetical protein